MEPQNQWRTSVLGEDYAAAGYAVGQAQCEDSLSNVLYCLHAGVGRLAEVFGPKMVQADIAARKLRNGYFAERDWPTLSQPVRELIEGYCAGVNAYIEDHPEEMLVPIEAVTPVQVIAWQRALLLLSAVGITQGDAEASKADGYHPVYNPNRLGASDSAAFDSPSRRHPGVPPGKSNSWALASEKTACGVPMLLVDPHWPAEGHLQLYELWLHVGDELHVGGFCSTGTPLPSLGTSAHAAWTFTAGGADSADAYALKINPNNPHQYEFDGGWREMDVRHEAIRARQPDDSFSEQVVEVLMTHHGPVLEAKGGTPFAAAIGGFERADCFEQIFRMGAARNTAEFKQALAMNRLSFFNVMWATTDGDIGYVQTGQAPLRPLGFDWNKLLPGWTSAADYLGEIALEDHPQVENPLTGFLQNCNVSANVVTPGLTFTRDDFPPGVLFGHYGEYRARGARATQLLTEVDHATLEDARRIAFDTYVPPADLWVPIILQGYVEWKAGTDDDQLQTGTARRLDEAVRLIGRWNRYADPESLGATVFRFWRLACHEMDSPVGRDQFAVPNNEAVRRDAVQALQTAANRLHENYGRVAVPWGDIKRLRRGEKEWPLGGDGLGKLGMDSLRATAVDTFNGEGKLIAGNGQCVTSVVQLTNPPTIHAVVAYGQSNKPNSPHFADQAPLYSREHFREVPWTLEQLKPVVESQITFDYAP